MPDTHDTVATFLAASLAAVQRDAASCAEAMAAAIGPVTIALVVDGEQVVVRAQREVTIARTASRTASKIASADPVHVVTTGGALLALIEGRDELHPAIVANRVRVRAAPRDAERLFDAMRYFVEGCARSNAAPALLADFRSQVCASQERTRT
jgi:hypothetical protein